MLPVVWRYRYTAGSPIPVVCLFRNWKKILNFGRALGKESSVSASVPKKYGLKCISYQWPMGSRPSLSSMGCDHSRPRNVLEQTSFLISSSEQTLLPLPLVVLHLYHQRMLTATLLYLKLKEGSDRVSKQKERASA